VQIGSLLSITNVLHAKQVHVSFRATLLQGEFGVGAESLQVGLYREEDIPWEQIAFPSIEFALRSFFEDRRLAREILHFSDIDRPAHR
jgi:hypothetical protein